MTCITVCYSFMCYLRNMEKKIQEKWKINNERNITVKALVHISP